jgi:DnaD/phage-associated family protein
MATFKGFPEGKTRLTPIPASFFRELLPAIDHLEELKLILYVFWKLDRMEGSFRYLRRSDLSRDTQLMKGLEPVPEKTETTLDEALERLVTREVLLRTIIQLEEGEETLYFLNSPKGRAAFQAIQNGRWRPSGDSQLPIELALERPNIFQLYEQHIGPLTPMIAEALQDAEQTYPEAWVEEAMRIAVENNVRRWRYVEAILRSWKEEGRDEQDRGDTEKDRRRYIEGKYSEFIEHG